MGIKAFLKRAVPFFLTLAVGLFIASFFVSVAAPNFNFPKRNWNNRHRDYHRRMEFENRRLREENNRLKNRLAEKERETWKVDPDFAVPPPPPLPTKPMKTVPYTER